MYESGFVYELLDVAQLRRAVDIHSQYRQKQIQRLISECCVLTHITSFLRPLRPVRPGLCCNAPRYRIASGASRNPGFCPDTCISSTMPLMHPNSNFNTISHQDILQIPLSIPQEHPRVQSGVFLAQENMVSAGAR